MCDMASVKVSANLNDGYKFYRNVLKSPKYVVAPMVAQSEVAWRMMARKHGAHLCYTPMCSANTFLNDKNYRNEVLQDISCKEDRPLIVQFCANTAEKFIKAALAVQDHCDGVDLNLGCPQHIALRGYFGAYLQDSWTLIHEIISESRKYLSVGVTAKIRVFPEIATTIEYAQMLENAGCHLLTVHGRTREQKRDKTGLASWEHIRAVKKNVDIPVFANGNIRFAHDVDACFNETGVDGVMVAEGHLTNPMIFEGLHPNVFDVVEEYLSFVERYPTQMSFIRTHIFNILSTTLLHHKDRREVLGQSNSMKIIEAVVKRLKEKCSEEEKEQKEVSDLGFPHWICQPYNRFCRPKVKSENEDEKNKEDCEENEEVHKKSKSARKKLFEHIKWRKRSEEKRANEHKRRRERDKEMEKILAGPSGIQKDRILRVAERKQAVLDRMSKVMEDDSQSIVVCLDLTWSHVMNDKEINKLSSQLGRLYGSNRNSEKPAHIYFTGFQQDGKLWNECIRKHNRFENYKIEMTSKPYQELFQSNDVVYLTPDADTALESVEPGRVYVLGGLVDETVTKKLTLDSANESGICTRRLPVVEHMRRSGRHSNYSTVYCVNQVFDMLLAYHVTQDWKSALSAGVPPRKGYVFENNEEIETTS